MLYRQGVPSPDGVVYFRFVSSSLEDPAEYLLTLLERPELSLSGKLTVAERDRMRQRPLPPSVLASTSPTRAKGRRIFP